MLFKRGLLAVSLLTCALFSHAEGDIKIGKQKSAMCAACHGQNGMASNPQYPNLAGQNATYLESALRSYKSAERKGGQAAVMYGMVAALSESDIKNLAAYFNSLTPTTK